MLALNKFFENPNIIGFISDSTIDFTLQESSPLLTESQKQYLSKQAGCLIDNVSWAKQVHGTQALVVDETFLKSSTPLQHADAVVTNLTNVPIAIRTADCVPIFVYDPNHHVIALIHAGWQGTHQEIFKHTYKLMQDRYKSDIEDLLVSFGPAIRSCCYQVGEEFVARFPQSIIVRDGKLFLDLIKSNRDQLFALGLERQQLFDCRVCTCCDNNYFSFRRDKEKSGRMISMMMIHKNN